MVGFIATTDFDWYSYLRDQRDLDEVNFWQPSGGRGFHAIAPGAPFFFKLKSPHYAIGGFGYFARNSVLPDWLAWDSFGRANGAPDLQAMRERIRKYRRRFGGELGDGFHIGCLMISQPVFFEERDWIPQPRDWAANIVSGATYNLDSGEGQRVWLECLARAATRQSAEIRMVAEERARYGEPVLVQPRLGQGTFRIAVTDAYRRACAVSGEHSLPVLDVAHIKPYGEGGEHEISNGLLLRTDIHRLFARGHLSRSADERPGMSWLDRGEREKGGTCDGLPGTRLTLSPGPEEQ